jgi:phosphoribosylformylglycinamidine synthase II
MARKIFEKWKLDFAVVGRLTDTKHMVLKMGGEVVADLPIPPLVDASPVYDRPWVKTPRRDAVSADDVSAPEDLMATLKTLMGCPDIASKQWIWDQYDHMVMGDTVARPGGDAAITRVHGSQKALAITSDCTPRYCLADPVQGGRQVVAEAWRNITATGATPLAVTDNMNFGNPEKPEIMGQFVGCIEGMREACLELDFPVVSGNVSLYNETNGNAILPTPVIGGVGLLDDVSKAIGSGFQGADDSIIVIGKTQGHLGASLYLREIEGREDGPPPPVDLAEERKHGNFVRAQILEGRISACHDISDGGLGITLAEMALSGNMGAEVHLPKDSIASHVWLFGEDKGRYVLATDDPVRLLAAAARAEVPAARIGTTTGDTLTFVDQGAITLSDLRRIHESWMPEYMSTP